MVERTRGTLSRLSKGLVVPPPALEGMIGAVANIVGQWPGIAATAHWDLYDSSRIDGIDFYVGTNELGHIHLDGLIHLATSPTLGKSLIHEGLAQRFPYAIGWVQTQISKVGPEISVALFRRNYERFIGQDKQS